LFTPAQINRAQPTGECTFCNMTVLLQRPEPVPEALPLTWPKGFAVTETPAPKLTSVDRALVPGNDPYRDPASPALALRQGLSIAWKDDNFYLRIGLVFTNLCLWGSGTTIWILMVLGVLVGNIGLAIVWTLVAVACGWFTRVLWRNARLVRADHEGLHWTRVAWTTRVVQEHVPASKIAQLFVRDETPKFGTFEDGIAIPAFALYAREHGGRDHFITQVEDPEQAWWLEARLEQHLGIADQSIDGEHRREPGLLPGPSRTT
jgi:hypothetical protein